MSEEVRQKQCGLFSRILEAVERAGNKLPDPAILFVVLLCVVWISSWLLSFATFAIDDPRTGEPLVINNLISGQAIAAFMSDMVTNFTHFHPVGVVLVAMLGIGVAEHSGFINAALRILLSIAPKWLLTPAVIVAGIFSHTAVDAGYVLVIPLGGVIFYTAGRHPLAGIAAAFAGVSGGFSASFVPSPADPLLQGLSQAGAQIVDPNIVLNPLNNYFFTAASSFLIIGLGWYVTEKIVEPRLGRTKLTGHFEDLPTLQPLASHERKGLFVAGVTVLLGVMIMVATAWPAGSPWRDASGELASGAAPMMRSIVSLIFMMFVVPGYVYGIVAGTVKSSKDIIEGMTKAMQQMAYYMVIMFFIAQFVYAFGQSNLGILLALQGAIVLKALAMPSYVTVIGVVFITAFINLFVGSASAKWGLLATVFVPMLMQLGVSPDLTQAAYRIGDSSTNIITPLLPYFPLVVVYCQRYVRNAGIGTVTALMLPYSVTFLVFWTIFLLLFIFSGFPLGIQSNYTYP